MSLVVDAVSHGSGYKTDDEMSEFRRAVIVSLFTDQTRIRDGTFQCY